MRPSKCFRITVGRAEARQQCGETRYRGRALYVGSTTVSDQWISQHSDRRTCSPISWFQTVLAPAKS